MTTTQVWHVTPESNIESIEENGIEPSPCTIRPMKMEQGDYKRLEEGIYVCGTRRTIETYSGQALHDIRDEMAEGERLALFKATVDRSRLWDDPEPAGEMTAYICEDVIDDPELVTVGILDEPAGDFTFEKQ